jgi:DNA polymerase III epsilon subunit-like protein
MDIRHARVLEIGAMFIVKGRLVPEFHFASLINPLGAIPPESIAIHGITGAMVESADSFARVYKHYREFAGAT